MLGRIDDSGCEVELTRRNLLTLLAKLDGDPPDSVCTIMKDIADGKLLVVRAVENSVHYSDRPAGVMHPDTEAALRERREHNGL